MPLQSQGHGTRHIRDSLARNEFSQLIVAVIICVVGCAANAGPAPLADTAERRDATAIAALLDKRADVNASQADGMTALHWAVYHDDAKLVRRLIDAGADVKAKNRYGVTSLSLACLNGNGEIVTVLLDAGADANTALPGGETALMTAARTGRLEAVKALIDSGADVNAKNRSGQTAIMWAAADGHAQVVQSLISAGAEFLTPLASGFTPLFFAVREGRTDVVRVLLQAGADVNGAMEVSKRAGNKGPKPGISPLIMAVENGHFELAAMLLEAGADPNDQRSGFTALHTLTWVRKPDRGDDGNPPPIGSGSVDSLQFAEQLVRYGADVNARLERGNKGGGNRIPMKGATPFFMAADTADVPLMKLLLALGADPSIPNVDNTTPLMVAAGIGTHAPTEEAGTDEEALEAVKLLLELGADVNAVDDNGETAMHGAAFKSLPDVVKHLAERGAKIEIWNRKNKRGWTPLLIAQGFRPGNFKPSEETIAAISELMLAAGITPPPPPAREKKAWEE